MTRFIGEFPHPERTLSLSISSKRTIALTDFSALFVGGDWDGFLNKFTVEATYDRWNIPRVPPERDAK